MKEFWNQHKKLIGKMVLNQFGATFLGIMIVVAAAVAQSQRAWLMLLASCFATLFYMFLIYNVLWEKGGLDRIRVDGGRAERKPWTGFWITLAANIPNLILAAVVLISDPFKSTQTWAVSMNVIGRSLCLLWEGMYAGIVSYFSPHNPIIHLLVVFPALFMGTVSYMLGLGNRRILAFFELKKPKK